MSESNGYMPSAEAKALTSAVGTRLKEFFAEAAGRDRVLLDQVSDARKELLAAVEGLTKSASKQEGTAEYVIALEKQVRGYLEKVEWVKSLAESRMPPEVRVEVAPAPNPPPTVDNHIEPTPVKLEPHIIVDITPVANALLELGKTLASFFNSLNRQAKTLEQLVKLLDKPNTKRAKRSFTIKHDDGTESMVVEE